MLVFIILIAFGVTNANPRKEPRVSTGSTPFIIGGENAKPGEFPHQLSLEFLGNHVCGASLLSAEWAMTACHCADGRDAEDMAVVAGGTNFTDDTEERQRIDITAITEHPNCSIVDAGVPFDFSLIRLASPADVSKPNIAAAALPPAGAIYVGNKNCWISGFGIVNGSELEFTDHLQKANVDVINNTECRQRMSDVDGAQIDPWHICVTDLKTGSKGACNGDSGGPLTCTNNQGVKEMCGVTSWGVSNLDQDCLTTHPSVYARVSHVLDWIKQVTGLPRKV